MASLITSASQCAVRGCSLHPLPCPLYVMGGTDDPRYRKDQLEAWTTVAGNAHATIRWFPGGHGYVLEPAWMQCRAWRGMNNTAVLPAVAVSPVCLDGCCAGTFESRKTKCYLIWMNSSAHLAHEGAQAVASYLVAEQERGGED